MGKKEGIEKEAMGRGLCPTLKANYRTKGKRETAKT